MCGKLTTKEFIKKAKEIHGNKYDYSKVEYTNSRTKVCIICPKHGEFWQKAGTHLEGHGCPLCGNENTTKSKKLDTQKFIEKAKKVHGDKYDYSKVNYINSKTKVCIICPEHGEFWMKPNDHLSRKYGCHKCGWINEGMKLRKTKQEFISEAKKKYGNKFDYSKVIYDGNDQKVCIISHEKDAYGVEVGEFWQTPSNHLTFGYSINNLQITTDKFIERTKKIHGNLYDYTKTIFNGSNNKVTITCPIHGDFEQLPHTHLNGSGCPKCKNKSVLEKLVRKILIDLKFEFEEQKRFNFLGRQSIDFYLPKYGVGIECQGRQHFIESKLWEKLDTIIERDKNKKDLCKENNIEILYVVNKNYSNMIKDIYTANNTCNIKNLEEVLLKLNKNEK